MKQEKINKRIGKIKAYFKREIKKQNNENLAFYIKKFEVKKDLSKSGIIEIISIRIIIDIKTPKTNYSQKKYFIILTKTAKIYLINENGKNNLTLKKVLNKNLLK